jgi:hypothetical protein
VPLQPRPPPLRPPPVAPPRTKLRRRSWRPLVRPTARAAARPADRTSPARRLWSRAQALPRCERLATGRPRARWAGDGKEVPRGARAGAAGGEDLEDISDAEGAAAGGGESDVDEDWGGDWE